MSASLQRPSLGKWVPIYASLHKGEKRILPRATRCIYAELLEEARDLCGDIVLPPASTDAEAIREVIGGRLDEIEEALPLLSTPLDHRDPECEPMIRVTGPCNKRIVTVVSWGLYNRPLPSSADRVRKHRAKMKRIAEAAKLHGKVDVTCNALQGRYSNAHVTPTVTVTERVKRSPPPPEGAHGTSESPTETDSSSLSPGDAWSDDAAPFGFSIAEWLSPDDLAGVPSAAELSVSSHDDTEELSREESPNRESTVQLRVTPATCPPVAAPEMAPEEAGQPEGPHEPTVAPNARPRAGQTPSPHPPTERVPFGPSEDGPGLVATRPGPRSRNYRGLESPFIVAKYEEAFFAVRGVRFVVKRVERATLDDAIDAHYDERPIVGNATIENDFRRFAEFLENLGERGRSMWKGGAQPSGFAEWLNEGHHLRGKKSQTVDRYEELPELPKLSQEEANRRAEELDATLRAAGYGR